MHDDFWKAIDQQLQQLRTARTVQDVFTALADPPHAGGSTNEVRSAGEAFFAGSGGADSMLDALIEAGWRLTWIEADYYWSMHTPDGTDSITYIEGDVFQGQRR